MNQEKNFSMRKISEQEIKNYVLERFTEVKREHKVKNFVSFHTMNKFMLMAHDQDQLKQLGNIVANHQKNSFLESVNKYEKHLKIALEKIPTIKSHTNVIMHIFGHFSDKFNQSERKEFLDFIGKFRKNEITLGEILSNIHSMVFRFNNTYLAGQTYFLLYSDPEPQNLFGNLHKQ